MWPIPKPARDGRRTGRAAGLLLAETLCQLIDDERPTPIVGASCDDAGEAVVEVFPDGGLGDAQRWLATAGIVDPFFLEVKSDRDELRVYVPGDADGDVFDLVMVLGFRRDHGGQFCTTLPAFTVADGADGVFEAFQEGLADGLDAHPRTAEIHPGFGALGDYQGEL